MSRVFTRLLSGGSLTTTYATSLFKVGEKQQNLNAIYQSLLTINDKIGKANDPNVKSSGSGPDVKLMNIINNPTLSQNEKNIMLEYLSNVSHNTRDTKKNVTTPKEINNFLSVLMNNNRLNLLPSIITDFQSLMNKYNNIINIEIITMKKLNNSILDRLNKILTQSEIIKQLTTSNTLVKKNSNKPKLKLNLIGKIDPNIKGGIIIKIEDKTIDLSIATKLQKLNSILNESI